MDLIIVSATLCVFGKHHLCKDAKVALDGRNDGQGLPRFYLLTNASLSALSITAEDVFHSDSAATR
jgi:hypothetical protein